MAEDEEGKPAGETADDPKMRMMEALAEKLKDEVKVEEFTGPRTVDAVAAVSFHGDTVYCTNEGGTRLASAAISALAVHLGCVLVQSCPRPRGSSSCWGRRESSGFFWRWRKRHTHAGGHWPCGEDCAKPGGHATKCKGQRVFLQVRAGDIGVGGI